jgi:hypothetical protein
MQASTWAVGGLHYCKRATILSRRCSLMLVHWAYTAWEDQCYALELHLEVALSIS